MSIKLFWESNESVFLDFTSGLLLGLSVGMKLIGIILIYIVKSRGRNEKEDFNNYIDYNNCNFKYIYNLFKFYEET